MPHTDEIRIQVGASKADADRLTEAATAAGFTHSKGGRSAYMLDRALAAADAQLGAATVTIGGDIGKAITADAAAEGITLEVWFERALGHARVARTPAGTAGSPARRRGRDA